MYLWTSSYAIRVVECHSANWYLALDIPLTDGDACNTVP